MDICISNMRMYVCMYVQGHYGAVKRKGSCVQFELESRNMRRPNRIELIDNNLLALITFKPLKAPQILQSCCVVIEPVHCCLI